MITISCRNVNDLGPNHYKPKTPLFMFPFLIGIIVYWTPL